MSFVGKLGSLIKSFFSRAANAALHGIHASKIADLLNHAKAIISIVEDAFPGPGRGDEKWEAAMNALSRYVAQEGIRLLEFQLENILDNAFAQTLGAEKLQKQGQSSSPPPLP